jgi:hypothetical protein
MANRLTNKTVALPARGEREQRRCSEHPSRRVNHAKKAVAGRSPATMLLSYRIWIFTSFAGGR